MIFLRLIFDIFYIVVKHHKDCENQFQTNHYVPPQPPSTPLALQSPMRTIHSTYSSPEHRNYALQRDKHRYSPEKAVIIPPHSADDIINNSYDDTRNNNNASQIEPSFLQPAFFNGMQQQTVFESSDGALDNISYSNFGGITLPHGSMYLPYSNFSVQYSGMPFSLHQSLQHIPPNLYLTNEETMRNSLVVQGAGLHVLNRNEILRSQSAPTAELSKNSQWKLDEYSSNFNKIMITVPQAIAEASVEDGDSFQGNREQWNFPKHSATTHNSESNNNIGSVPSIINDTKIKDNNNNSSDDVKVIDDIIVPCMSTNLTQHPLLENVHIEEILKEDNKTTDIDVIPQLVTGRKPLPLKVVHVGEVAMNDIRAKDNDIMAQIASSSRVPAPLRLAHSKEVPIDEIKARDNDIILPFVASRITYPLRTSRIKEMPLDLQSKELLLANEKAILEYSEIAMKIKAPEPTAIENRKFVMTSDAMLSTDAASLVPIDQNEIKEISTVESSNNEIIYEGVVNQDENEKKQEVNDFILQNLPRFDESEKTDPELLQVDTLDTNLMKFNDNSSKILSYDPNVLMIENNAVHKSHSMHDNLESFDSDEAMIRKQLEEEYHKLSS